MGRWPLGSGGAPLSWTPGDIWALARCGSWRSSRRSVVGGVVGVVRGLLWRARLVHGDDAEDPTISWLAGWRQGISVVVARQAAQTSSRRAVADLADQWGAAAMAV